MALLYILAELEPTFQDLHNKAIQVDPLKMVAVVAVVALEQ
jgi:hypothetical protein